MRWIDAFSPPAKGDGTMGRRQSSSPPLSNQPVALTAERMGADSRGTLLLKRAAIWRAANSAPNMKRIAGPKLFADAGPTKYNPATEDSKFAESIGALSVDRS